MKSRALVDIIDWEYPAERGKYEPRIVDLNNWKDVELLVLLYGNGVIIELRTEGESEDAIQAMRGLAIGTGRAKLIELTDEQKKNLWFYHEGDECYVQSSGGEPFSFSMIDPIPRPEKFPST
jgi:hypothetical protein